MILAIIQARMGSSRLPGKVLLDLAGRPVLQHVFERVSAACRIDRVMVATTDRPSDEPVRRFCENFGIDCFAGSEDDVLDRFYRAALSAGLKKDDGVVRITADCPLTDPEVVSLVVSKFRNTGADYVSNVQPPTYPDGLDVEVFKFDALERAWTEASLCSEREHVTPFIRKHPELFKQENVENAQDFSAHRWTLDEPGDYELLKLVFQEMDLQNSRLGWQDVRDLITIHPEWKNCNSRFSRNEGYVRSLAADTHEK